MKIIKSRFAVKYSETDRTVEINHACDLPISDSLMGFLLLPFASLRFDSFTKLEIFIAPDSITCTVQLCQSRLFPDHETKSPQLFRHGAIDSSRWSLSIKQRISIKRAHATRALSFMRVAIPIRTKRDNVAASIVVHLKKMP